jgi:putative proteasome-type protease
MTFCLGIKLQDSLLALADTRLTSGHDMLSARKLTLHKFDNRPMFLMTSGLRAVRDKALTYFEDYLKTAEQPDRLYKVVNAFAAQVRRVASEDEDALSDSGLPFNLYAIIGGQLSGDSEPKMYLMYPQGNWVEIGNDTPFVIIGEAHYGKPILQRLLRHDTPPDVALKMAMLAYDATHRNATNAGYPVDVAMYRTGSDDMTQHRFQESDFQDSHAFWQERLASLIEEMPAAWLDDVLAKMK